MRRKEMKRRKSKVAVSEELKKNLPMWLRQL
jgi:hypothetical protein